MITVRNLDKIYQTRTQTIHALRDISFDITEGEFITVVGPSGCGKSTLLKIIAGITAKTVGQVKLDDQEITGPNPKIGVVFQSPVMLPWRTVYQNVMLPVDVRGQARRKYHDRALSLLKMVGLAGFEERYHGELSGGMQQRAAICRALINDPDILLMDEPFGALDAMTREYMNLELQNIWQESGKTIFFITHSISEAVFLANRVLVMTPRPGRIEEIITIDLPRPRSLNMMTTEEFGSFVRHIRAKFGSEAVFD